MLGALAALILVFFAGVVMMFGLLVVIGAKGEAQAPIVSDSVLVVQLDANFTDAPPEIDFGNITGERVETIQLSKAIRAIKAAGKDNRIKGLFLTGSLMPEGLGSGYAALRELREALLEFKASHKPIHAYLSYVSTRDYYLASVADDIALDPYGVVVIPGLASESVFFAKAFKRFGIGVQVTRVGKYKGAVEPFTRDDLSPENREQLQGLLNDVWQGILADIAASRNLSVQTLQQIVDQEGLIRADMAKQAGLVDRVVYRDIVLDDLKAATGVKSPSAAFKQVDLLDYMSTVHLNGKMGAGKIAVLYAEGDIVDGEGDWSQVGGDRFARELRALRQDDSVKAIVLRVNSPGGSASASEVIQREMRLAVEKKPVVVSMGSYAASGGYWISTYGERIFAQPTTITGSIGVFGLLFDVQELTSNLGIHFDRVKTGRFADALSISRPKTDAEIAVLQRSVDWIYDQFVGKVAEARKLDREFVQEIAQGRVWSGVEAQKLGLVDELGGLSEAIDYTAKKLGLGRDYRILEYPKSKNLGEAIAEMLHRLRPAGVRAGIYKNLVKRLEAELKTLHAYNDPQGLYTRLPVSINLQ